jgi:hypothetical protein
VPVANAAPFVPAAYTIALGAPGEANAIVRVAQCASVVVRGQSSGPGIVAQLGVNIVSPDGTGDINNYAVWYGTDGLALASGLRQAGVAAQFDPWLFYQRLPSANGTTARVLIANAEPPPPFIIDSVVLIPTPATQPIDFTAHWWQTNGATTAEMASDFPNILFGPESDGVTIEAVPGTKLAKLLGADVATFVGLSVANVIPTAHMHVGPASP